MKRFLLTFVVFCSLLLANTEPPMPLWNAEEHAKLVASGWIAGDSLLQFEPLPNEVKAAETPLTVDQPTAEELADEEVDENEVREEFLVYYFAAKPLGHLVDPQSLLGTREAKDLEAFLAYHSGDSSIDLFVYIFGADHHIPSDVREEEVVERLYSVGKPAMVVYYYLGAPQRSEIYLSPILTDAVSASEQRRALQSSVVQAFSSTDADEQLQAFLVQISIRLYWMERMTQGTADETMEAIPSDSDVRKFHLKNRNIGGKIVLPDWAGLAAAVAAASLGAFILIYVSAVWWRARSRFVFPDFEVEPRLGGSHAAGIGAVISFSSATVPPARQRNQVPDYMRRA